MGPGILADRLNRKILLGVGLIGNSIAIALMGLTRQYELLLLLGVIAGMFGTLFHPAANALASAHYPKSPGTVIGIIGIGAGIGFFVGPRFAGWRAGRRGGAPLIEMGAVGVVVGILFLLLAKEVRGQNARSDGERTTSKPMTPALRRRVLSAASVLGWRDFSAHASTTLASIYLLKAQGRTVAETGLILGSMMLVSVVVNPLSVWASLRSTACRR